MRRITFEVPEELIGDFTALLTESGLENQIVGRTEEQEIEIEVFYDKEEAEQVDDLENELEELKTKWNEEHGEEEEEEEEDEN